MNKKIIYIFAFLFIITTALVQVVFAQQEELFEEIIIDENTSEEHLNELYEMLQLPGFTDTPEVVQEITWETGVNCFDFYRFGSVEAPIATNVTSTVNGATIAFTTKLKNTNNYPILHGALYVKIFRERDSLEKNANGPYVVDQFIVQDKLSLDAHEERDVQFEWSVPAWAVDGQYRIATFFVSNRSYNFLGLSFTDDIVGNMTQFRVMSDVSETVMFAKDAVEMNGVAYNFAGFPLSFNDAEPVTITTPIRNTTNSEVSVPVQFTLYDWDAMRSENELSSQKQWVTIPANSTKIVSFTVTDTTAPVYLAEIVLQYEDTKSILNPRFVRKGISRPRINFPGIDTYPLRTGQETNLFACVHNTADAVAEGRVELTLYDKDRNVIHSYEYTGSIPGDMIGLGDKFVPKKNYGSLFLEARLYDKDNVLIEETVLQYKCDQLGSCDVDDNESRSLFMLSTRQLVTGGVVVILALLISGILFKIRKRVQI